MAEKNGTILAFNFREAWLRMLALDFEEGASLRCHIAIKRLIQCSATSIPDRPGILSNRRRIHGPDKGRRKHQSNYSTSA